MLKLVTVDQVVRDLPIMEKLGAENTKRMTTEVELELIQQLMRMRS
jgi:hypothetical protein